MATFNYETMSQADATGFVNTDTLIFTSTATTPSQVVVTQSASGSTTMLTVGTRSLIFPTPELDQAAIQFTSSFNAGSSATLIVGGTGADTNISTSASGDFVYSFAGADSVSGGAGADNLFGGTGADTLDGNGGHDNVFGEAGSDLLNGGNGNDHLYGFGLTGDPSTDVADTINAGDGSDYVQGNAGADSINGDAGSDRLNGGADADTINGGTDNDTVNGNRGADVINGDAGNDSLRGGQDADSISGGGDDDVLIGDLGDDTIVGGTGIDLLTGSGGGDTFQFAAGDVGLPASSGDLAGFVDTITDFAAGGTGAHVATDDLLDIANNVGLGTGNVLKAQAGITLESVTAARTYAQQLLNANTQGAGGAEVVVLQVGADAYLFYDSDGTDGGAIDSIIKLQGVSATNVTVADFI